MLGAHCDAYEKQRSHLQENTRSPQAYAPQRKVTQAKQHIQTLRAEEKKAEAQIEKLISRIVLEQDKFILAEKMQNLAKRAPTFLRNPYKFWACRNFDLRRLVLKLMFLEPIPNCRETGYRTAPLSLPFNTLEAQKDNFCAENFRKVPNDPNKLSTILAELDGWEDILRGVDVSNFQDAPQP